ncbi:MAG: hypothetical protein EAZ39_09325 [Oscillatoriales cyanobacterium]|uniref:hypothetical protein n=1 Tax=unclassified Microcoleus TaxID=2642155 RepID=UPI001D835F0C|nr:MULTISPECIES: hypothetical protein [unclassified Microcoleus]TAF97529.1 MAG: hypothetical protein EAZ45_21880 [Oscillatoriales cyanobacterium]MCC3438764.1 hypothetical protein [Microcoleus sp. PH2017_05_CCC_O_A]MCC3566497.1 hypothetical protein [Microcoleus sp. PH2017_31_RDM_U_A]MCC3578900.1 hypothetical protein [Microcoleus sp. PH2017_32_RDM_D_A]MCC3616871.1 hypothetical protein [Microcoleus sp. PH2017_38_RDM_U_B]
MKLTTRLACLLALSTLTVGVSPAFSNPLRSSQSEFTDITVTSNNIELNRAKNLARQAAENTNGGLGEYRAEASMHGASAESPFVDNGDGTWTFTFQGYKPGSSVYTVETVVTVSQHGRITVNYNGRIRSSSRF